MIGSSPPPAEEPTHREVSTGTPVNPMSNVVIAGAAIVRFVLVPMLLLAGPFLSCVVAVMSKNMPEQRLMGSGDPAAGAIDGQRALFTVHCPKCGAPRKDMDESDVGKQIRCYACNHVFSVRRDPVGNGLIIPVPSKSADPQS
jgi:hypothetical protein